MLPLYGLTIFVSAMLLFVVQPMFGRLALPLLGGAPAVWNTALVFYQAVLLAGYGYAHLLTSRLSVRRQVVVHVGVLALALLVLPIAIPQGWVPPRSANPMLWLLGMMTLSVGLPFFAVSASSPLLQTWFSRTNHRAAADPYFLYAASNLGSMLALLSYPLLLEPNIVLQSQTRLWAWGFGGLLVLMIGCGVVMWRGAPTPVRMPNTTPSPPAAPLANSRRGRWIVLSAVPSSLLVSVTTFLSTDLAAIPLLWIIPLAIYLLTFILVFASKPPIPQWLLVRALPILVLPLVVTIALQATDPLALLLPLHLVVFFVVTMVAHGELARDRPTPQHLTEFYLWMSFGGVLGGIFNALLAPLLFNSVAEYPITLVLACVVAPQLGAIPSMFKARRWDVLLPLAVALLVGGGIALTAWLGYANTPPGIALTFGLPTLLCFSLSRRPLRFGLGVAALLLASVWTTTALDQTTQGRMLYANRSFFGVNRVAYNAESDQHLLFHGSTLHGIQNGQPSLRDTPLSYYYPTGPIGQIFAATQRLPDLDSVAVVGLGAGSLACYRTPNQTWTFYEIDPVVVQIAQNPQYFTFLRDCTPQAAIELGDARLALHSAAANSYDVLVLDAYSSDAIPVHLITREALQLYLAKLSADGILTFHISNRHLDLEPVLADLARDAGLAALTLADDDVSDAEAQAGKQSSQWVVMARTPAALERLALNNRWVALRSEPNTAVWTDDYSSIVQTLR